MISYIESIQVLLSITTIIGISLLTSYLKMFSEKDISTLKRTIFFVALPALIFYRIALRELIYETWMPLVHSICTQLTINLLIILIVTIVPFKNKFVKFLEIVFSCSYSSFFYGYEIINILYGEKYIFIPVVSSIVHYFLMNPINTLIICFLDQDSENSGSDFSQNSNSTDLDELDAELEDKKGLPIHPVEMPSNSSSNDNIDHNDEKADNSNSSIGDIENPNIQNKTTNSSNQNQDENNDEESLTSKPEFEKNPETVYDYPDEIENQDRDAKKDFDDESFDDELKTSKLKLILKKVLSPLNIAVILGIIWSIWHWPVPILIEKTANFLELAVPCTGFTCIGLSMWSLSLSGCNWIEVCIYLFIHYVVLPGVAILWSFVLKFDHKMATICILVNIAPVSFSGFFLAKKSKLEMKPVFDTFLWSNVIYIPVFMLWILAINKTHLFEN
ncbi:hypothetical protein M9Y10_045683 [Tritrichomonas musculus]|uniref:Auxin Efflux Carrier family protein n=1 Tax=Tritrichomonas musculus TaxID=1915356 RepID=A0ABR2JVX3_9EUKA